MNIQTIKRAGRGWGDRARVEFTDVLHTMDPGTGTTITEITYACRSSSRPWLKHEGKVCYDGQLYSVECSCEDFKMTWARENQEPTIEGHRFCRHAIAALYAAKYAPALEMAKRLGLTEDEYPALKLSLQLGS